MDDTYLERYSRHILLNEIGIEGQARIAQGRVLIVGLGGLGSPAAMYLALAGVGNLWLADGDSVDFSNLQRQILHRPASVGQLKVDSARATLKELGGTCSLQCIKDRVSEASAYELIRQVDVVLDCSDNFSTRYLLNRVCFALKKPLVSGAAIRFSGLLSTFTYQPDTPCYGCLFPEGEDIEELRCATTGVFSPLTGTVGCLQAAEALKLIGGFGEVLSGQLLRHDALTGSLQFSRFTRDPHCPICT